LRLALFRPKIPYPVFRMVPPFKFAIQIRLVKWRTVAAMTDQQALRAENYVEWQKRRKLSLTGAPIDLCCAPAVRNLGVTYPPPAQWCRRLWRYYTILTLIYILDIVDPNVTHTRGSSSNSAQLMQDKLFCLPKCQRMELISWKCCLMSINSVSFKRFIDKNDLLFAYSWTSAGRCQSRDLPLPLISLNCSFCFFLLVLILFAAGY